MTTAVIIAPSPVLAPARLFTPTPKAAKRMLEFFTAQINNDHTRKSYLNATRRFAEWCEINAAHDQALRPAQRSNITRRDREDFDMSAVTLTRSDITRNLHRFYRLNVQPNLFGQWCFIREWGRIGRAGQTRMTPYPTPDQAQAALERQRGAKERRGYVMPRTRMTH